MSAGTLERLQRRFWQLISAPSGVAAGLKELRECDPGIAPLSGWVAADEETARQRLDVYANMYFYRLLDSLRHDFPAVAQEMGPERFHNLVTDYLLVHPPDDPSLRYVGRELPAYLRAHELSEGRPHLADLARLEWERINAFDAADATPLSVEDLQRLPAEQWPELALEVTPALRLMEAEFAVHERWMAAVQDARATPEEPEAPLRVPTKLVIWRRSFVVRHRPVDVDEATALEAITTGRLTFGELCELLATDGVALEASAERAATLLAGWVAAEMLALPAELSMPN